MAEVLLFHHALGLTRGVLAFADQLRAAGHIVHTPDLFEGRTFPTLEEGVAHAENAGFGTIIERGSLPAQKLAQTRTGARGALFFYSCVPPTEFGPSWPKEVPVQIHAMDADPIFTQEGDLEAAQQVVEAAGHGELFLYPGDKHYFADPNLPTYDEAAAALLTERVLSFLAAR
jgi:dienelactone hydrolase